MVTLGQDVETWYYCDASRVTHGPFDRETFDDLRRQGVVTATDLVWRDGWPQWQPSTVLPPPPAARPVPPPAQQSPPQPRAIEGSQPGSVAAGSAEQSGGIAQTTATGNVNPNPTPSKDGRVECSECRLLVPVSSTKMLGGQVVCDHCQELIIKRLVTESGFQEPGSGELRALALRVLAVVVGLILLYLIFRAISS